jgi:hypothetical protein
MKTIRLVGLAIVCVAALWLCASVLVFASVRFLEVA